MPDKLTDNEIIKALKEILEIMLVMGDLQKSATIGKALDLINRPKAEIERLTSGKCVYLSDDETTEYCVEGPCPKYKTVAEIKAEAYKECVEKAKEEINKHSYDVLHKTVINHKLDNLLKELVGDIDETKVI